MPSLKLLLTAAAMASLSPWCMAAKLAPAAPAVPVLVELSHSLDEERAERLEPLVDHFNNQSKEVRVRLVRRVEGSPPKHMNLVTREEYARFSVGNARFRPLHEVMREAKVSLDTASFSPELRDSLVDRKGQLVALPVAFSTPVLFFNKAAFRKAGLNPDAPPKTWAEMQAAAGALVDSGVRCAYTTSRPASMFIDNLSAWNAAEVSDSRGNLAFNGLAQVKHIAMMATWHKSRYFTYFGRGDEADRRFANGECAMLTSHSSLFSALADKTSLEAGVSSLPYHDDVYGAPQNTLADGASLWVANGLKPAETRGVAQFVKYILGPEVQINLTLAGGYLPMTAVARTAASSQLLKADLSGLQVAYSQLKGKASQPLIRVAQIEAVRAVVDEELEAVWANRKTAKEALDVAVQRGNALLRTMSPLTGTVQNRGGK